MSKSICLNKEKTSKDIAEVATTIVNNRIVTFPSLVLY